MRCCERFRDAVQRFVYARGEVIVTIKYFSFHVFLPLVVVDVVVHVRIKRMKDKVIL